MRGFFVSAGLMMAVAGMIMVAVAREKRDAVKMDAAGVETAGGQVQALAQVQDESGDEDLNDVAPQVMDGSEAASGDEAQGNTGCATRMAEAVETEKGVFRYCNVGGVVRWNLKGGDYPPPAGFEAARAKSEP